MCYGSFFNMLPQCEEISSFLLSPQSFIPRLQKFAGYVHYYKSLSGNTFGLIFRKQDRHHRHFFDSNQGYLHKLLLVLLCGRLNLFIGDMFNRYICCL